MMHSITVGKVYKMLFVKSAALILSSGVLAFP